MTADERAALITGASPILDLDARQHKQVSEALYTLAEAGLVSRLHMSEVFAIWAVVEMVKAGSFTEDMRL